MFIYKFDQHEKLVYKSTTPYILFDTQKTTCMQGSQRLSPRHMNQAYFYPYFKCG